MMRDYDKLSYFPAETKNPTNKYTQPKTYQSDMGKNGYPNAVANTQTMRTYGTKNTARGYGHSTKMG
jgi:hypothetical protein